MIGGKIIKPGGVEPDEFEKGIGQAILELELNSELKPQLRDLHITRAREIEFNSKKVIFFVIFFSDINGIPLLCYFLTIILNCLELSKRANRNAFRIYINVSMFSNNIIP